MFLDGIRTDSLETVVEHLERVVKPRVDHDMDDACGAVVGVESPDRLWSPRFGHALEPLSKADVRREIR